LCTAATSRAELFSEACIETEIRRRKRGLQESFKVMYSNPQKTSSDEVIELRHKAGQWLKKLREAQGLSQRQLAAAVGVEYYTFISQLETGRGRIPTDRCLLWAKALDVKPKHFVQTLMRYYDPVTYEILFEDNQSPPFAATMPIIGLVSDTPTSSPPS